LIGPTTIARIYDEDEDGTKDFFVQAQVSGDHRRGAGQCFSMMNPEEEEEEELFTNFSYVDPEF
jgi:hypothetical protein